MNLKLDDTYLNEIINQIQKIFIDALTYGQGVAVMSKSGKVQHVPMDKIFNNKNLKVEKVKIKIKLKPRGGKK